MTRRDPVTPEVAAFVFARDEWCIAPIVDPETWPCSGRRTLEHVKWDLRMGRRGASVPGSLVALCSGHTEEGRKGGRQWNTVKANRALVRDYLRSVNSGADRAGRAA